METNKVRIAAVSYLNTKPFIYGLLRSNIAQDIDLQLDIPSVCAQKLSSGAVDLALTPVAILPFIKDYQIVSDYCIGAHGKVQTVSLFSEVPLADIETIYLDFHSRTSVQLIQILSKYYWHIHPQFLPATEGFEANIGGKTAALIIGDRAIGLDRKYRYAYDLAEEWYHWKGLPFVFAAWVATKPLNPNFIADFNAALHHGLGLLPELVKILPTIPHFDLENYFRTGISYQLDEPKRNALDIFLSLLD